MQARRLRSVLSLLAALACTSDRATGPDAMRLEIVHVYGQLTGLSSQGLQDLVLMSADGSTRRTLVSLPGSESMPEWSPDGTRLLFMRFGDDRIWMVDENGGNLHAIPSTSSALWPRWSPDGQFIIYTRVPDTTPTEIVIIRADGTGERVLTADAFGSPSWSRDGRIAFRRATTGGIWTMRADGSELTRLNTLAGDNLPTWSPNGSRLLLWNLTSAGREGFVVVNADGSNRHDVAPAEAGAEVESPSWSPDSKWILFKRHWTSTSDAPRGCALYRVPADGGTPIVVLPEQPRTECEGASWR